MLTRKYKQQEVTKTDDEHPIVKARAETEQKQDEKSAEKPVFTEPSLEPATLDKGAPPNLGVSGIVDDFVNGYSVSSDGTAVTIAPGAKGDATKKDTSVLTLKSPDGSEVTVAVIARKSAERAVVDEEKASLEEKPPVQEPGKEE